MTLASQQQNLLIIQGSDTSVKVNLYDWPDQFSLVAAAAHGDTAIKVRRVNTEIPTGSAIDALQDDGQAFRTTTTTTTTTGTDSGQAYKSISVPALDRDLVKGWPVRIPQDISARTFEGQVRRSQYNSATGVWGEGSVVFSFANLRPATDAIETRGQLTLTFPAADTAGMVVSADLVGADIGKWCQSQLPKQPYIFGESVYTYSVEETTGGLREQKIYGRVFVTGDSVLPVA